MFPIKRTCIALAILVASVYLAGVNLKSSTPATNSSPPTNSSAPLVDYSSPLSMSVSIPLAAAASVVPRRWNQRGHADHDWLRTFHTFSFADYFDTRYMGFSNLRVINEDRVAPRTGFPTHPHAGAEIFSYIVSGELTHKDSMGNVETLKHGEVQFTSAGTGIRHSEYNADPTKECHFLQIWYTPDERSLPPRYYTAPVTDRTDKLVTLIKPWSTLSKEEQARTGLLPEGEAIPSRSSLVTRASIVTPGQSVSHAIGQDTDFASQNGTERWLYAHLAQTSGYKDPELSNLKLKNAAQLEIKTASGVVTLEEGDGAFIKGTKVGEKIDFSSVGQNPAEFVLFDLQPR